jgi:energy-coupling factor transport system permease protein
VRAISVDPRVKLSLFFTTCLFVMSVTRPVPNLCLGCFLLLLSLLSGEGRSAFRLFIPFALTLLALYALTDSLHGVPKALFLLLCLLVRLLTPVMMAFRLVFKTTTISQFMAAFQKMRVPAVLAIPFAVMFRFIPTLREEWTGIRQAMAFRGIRLGFPQMVRHPSISLEYVLVPLVFSAVSIMDELAAASLARGLDSDHERICVVDIRMRWTDWLFLAITIAFLLYWIRSSL